MDGNAVIEHVKRIQQQQGGLLASSRVLLPLSTGGCLLRRFFSGGVLSRGGGSSVIISRRFKAVEKSDIKAPPRAVGIDLGTTNSCVAVMENEQPKVIWNAEGAATTPSVVTFLADGSKLVGAAAKRQATLNPLRTIYAAKRLIGRRFAERATAKDIQKLPYKIVEAKNGDAWVEVDGKRISPSEVAAIVLDEMKTTASNYLGHPVSSAVVTVPAYFDDAQRQATKVAGQIAGLNILRIVNEPTAAALAFGMDKKLSEGKKVAVFDLGGGTFDISILELHNGLFEVKATNGDAALGGEDFDRRITDYIVENFTKLYGPQKTKELLQDSIAMQRVREAAVQAKINLSGSLCTDISIPYLLKDVNLEMSLKRDLVESLVKDLVDRTVGPSEKCIKDAGLQKGEIDQVLLVGGMTRMPLVVNTVARIFGKEPSKAVNPDEAVALGAAIQAGILTGEVKDLLLLDVTPISLGIETMGGVFTRLIDRNTTLPIRRTQVFSTAVDNQQQVGIRVYQGEREMVADDKLLGQFDLIGIPPAPRGIPQIEVTFEVDANGIMAVSAVDKSTGKKQEITIQSSGGLTKEEINRLIEEAEANRELDKRKIDLVNLKNEADQLVHVIETQITNFQMKMSKDDVTTLREKTKALRTMIGSVTVDHTDDLKDAMKSAQKASWDISKRVYASS